MKKTIDFLDPNFSDDLLFVTLLYQINKQLESDQTPFTIREQITLSGEQNRKFFRKNEDDQSEPCYMKIMRFFDEYLGEKGEGDYGVKEMEKIDDSADRGIDLYTYVAEINTPFLTYCCYRIPDQLATFASRSF